MQKRYTLTDHITRTWQTHPFLICINIATSNAYRNSYLFLVEYSLDTHNKKTEYFGIDTIFYSFDIVFIKNNLKATYMLSYIL